MIQNSPDRSADSKQVDMDNLYRVVQYCENVTECRRVQLLHYFGETDFDPSQCRSRPDTVCDTCASSGSFVYKDITSEAKAFVESVNSIVHGGSRDWRKPIRSYTLNHFIDIFKVRISFVIHRILEFYCRHFIRVMSVVIKTAVKQNSLSRLNLNTRSMESTYTSIHQKLLPFLRKCQSVSTKRHFVR